MAETKVTLPQAPGGGVGSKKESDFRGVEMEPKMSTIKIFVKNVFAKIA